jgi:Tol biopolymer transport system component/predicted Ser/Thr protein kinase
LALVPGSRLGPYEILSALGAGGMGEVYRARDPRTGRDVAVKVAGAQFSERFDREVRAIAALNHPNICHLYDVGPNYLVMELVEGESLTGPLPVDEALRICRQIAAALEEAHAKGIVHRDLKPANIRITPDGTVKVLDFGLAKVAQADSQAIENSPTISLTNTQAGLILGTAAYMSPEQARGKPVDKRADIWAFGVVLYELVTGDRLFAGDSVPDTLIEVATKQPDWTRVPAPLLPLLRRCLEKDPNKRLRDIGDIDLLLTPVAAGAEPPVRAAASRPALAWAVAGLAILAASGLAFVHLGEPASAPPEVGRFQILPPAKTTFSNALLLSPDGRKVAFTTTGEGGNLLWVRAVDTVPARVVAPWTNNPVPFWSPDSRFLAYQQDGKLKKVDVAGGPPVTLSDAPLAFAGGAWSPDNVIVFADRAGGLMQVSAGGGIPAPLTRLDTKAGEASHALPSFLPDGRHFLYLRRSASAERTGVYVGSLDATPEQQAASILVATTFAAVYAAAPDPRAGTTRGGFLLFVRDSTLMAQPFDPDTRTLSGEPVPIADNLGGTAYGLAPFSASSTGTLVYRGGGGVGMAQSQLTWYDRQGTVAGTVGQPGAYNSIALSPDGTRAAVERNSGAAGSDLWLLETSKDGKAERFTFDSGSETSPVWSPDGARIVYTSNRDGGFNFYWKLSNGAGNEDLLFKSAEQKAPSDWSRDGGTLVYSSVNASSQIDVVTLPLEGQRKPQVFLGSPFSEYHGRLSPDGRWMAYESNEAGRLEVYVQPFPPSAERAGKHLLSIGGGIEPLWRRDGKELFYLSGRAIMAVDVDTGAVFKSGTPRKIFEGNFGGINGGGYRWDVAADGKRFLMKAAGDAAAQEPITLILNWSAGLNK